MISMMTTKSIEQFNSLSLNDQKIVTNLINHLSGKTTKKRVDLLGLLSLKLDFLCRKSPMSDDEVDELISSVRKECRCR